MGAMGKSRAPSAPGLCSSLTFNDAGAEWVYMDYVNRVHSLHGPILYRAAFLTFCIFDFIVTMYRTPLAASKSSLVIRYVARYCAEVWGVIVALWSVHGLVTMQNARQFAAQEEAKAQSAVGFYLNMLVWHSVSRTSANMSRCYPLAVLASANCMQTVDRMRLQTIVKLYCLNALCCAFVLAARWHDLSWIWGHILVYVVFGLIAPLYFITSDEAMSRSHFAKTHGLPDSAYGSFWRWWFATVGRRRDAQEE